MAKLRSIRCGDELDDDAQLVVRGGLLTAAVLRKDAMRMSSVYGIYGISVFALRDETLDDLAARLPMSRFEHLTIIATGEIRAAGLGIEATGRSRQHYTVTFAALEAGIARLCSCSHDVWENPYHDP